MKKATKLFSKRFALLISVSALVLSLVSGCGKGEDQAAQQPSAQQPSADDPLAQFPALTFPYKEDPNATLAEYKDGKLTGKEFASFLRTLNFMNPQEGMMIEAADKASLENYMHQYLATKILAERADDKTKAASKELGEKSFEQIKTQYLSLLGGDEAKFTKLMEQQKITKDEVVGMMAAINDSVEVLDKKLTDEELKAEYDKQLKADKNAFTIASVRHILILTENRKPEEALKIANDLEGKLKKGEDFATLAKEHSEDPGSKNNGGLYKDAYVNQWVPEFKEAALTQKIDEIGPPVKTSYGYHIIRVESRSDKTFDQVKEELRKKALPDQFEKFVKEDMDKLVTAWHVPEVTQPAKS
ncbi:peptidylprolyl isomerase [Brevibacillus sp. B_LB10_24]|uniref:peptidylprolyl isomerase n=1 Tax=Brevibacillus sp. B_LB10_24 TaxID=3380645 RepID=UPI0038BBF804